MADDVLILSSLFQGSFPDEWRRDSEFARYLTELTSLSVDKLIREPSLINEEQECVLSSTQKLAFNNYKTFIQTAECSREVFKDFISVETHVDQLVKKIPDFISACKQFGKEAQESSAKRKLNSLALSKHSQLLEVLEIPQLMETCVRNGYYEEAHDLSTHVRRLEKKLNNIPIIKNVATDIEMSRHLMLSQLIQQLQGNIQLPVCLRLVGLMKRMAVFSETQLRLKFLQARDHWLQSVLNTVPKDDPYLHVSKTIEACRVHLFDVVTQYKAIFPDDDSVLVGIRGSSSQQFEGALFCGWLNSKIWQFLQLLEVDLRRGVGERMDSLLSQCMYFGLSFSRVGADFRPLIMPIFLRVSLQSFQLSLRDAKHHFHESMKHFNMMKSLPSLTSSLPSSITPSSSTLLSPPHSLLPFPPLAVFTNAIIMSFNGLRACAPIAIATEVSRELDRVLQSTVHDLIEYHRVERNTFTPSESQAFQRLCAVVISDFLPFIEKCVSAIFPEDMVQQLASRTLLAMTKHQQDATTGLASVRKKVIVQVGISAQNLAEPLRAIVPEVFEEIEQKRVLQSVTSLSSPTASSAQGSLFSKPGLDDQPLAPHTSVSATTRVTEQTEAPSYSSALGEDTRSLPTEEPHPTNKSNLTLHSRLSVPETGSNGHKEESSGALMESKLNLPTKRLDGAV